MGKSLKRLRKKIFLPTEKVIDLLLPVIVLIGSAIGAMIYTGFLGGATDVVSAFAGCDAETSLIFANHGHGLCHAVFVSSAKGGYV